MKRPKLTGTSGEKSPGSQKRPGKSDKGKNSKTAKNMEDIHVLQVSDTRSMESIDYC